MFNIELIKRYLERVSLGVKDHVSVWSTGMSHWCPCIGEIYIARWISRMCVLCCRDDSGAAPDTWVYGCTDDPEHT